MMLMIKIDLEEIVALHQKGAEDAEMERIRIIEEQKKATFQEKLKELMLEVRLYQPLIYLECRTDQRQKPPLVQAIRNPT